MFAVCADVFFCGLWLYHVVCVFYVLFSSVMFCVCCVVWSCVVLYWIVRTHSVLLCGFVCVFLCVLYCVWCLSGVLFCVFVFVLRVCVVCLVRVSCVFLFVRYLSVRVASCVFRYCVALCICACVCSVNCLCCVSCVLVFCVIVLL